VNEDDLIPPFDFAPAKVLPMQDELTVALNLHNAGQLDAAARLYEKILTHNEKSADALHLLGVLSYQRGDSRRAVELIELAVAVQPNDPIFHANLAEAYRTLGQLERAVACCRAALRLSPEYAEALGTLGVALQGLGRPLEAAEHLRQALRLHPGFAEAHTNFGLALRDLGQFDEALLHFRRAVELAPTFATAQTNLGQLLLDRGQTEEALLHCEEAVRLRPDLAPLHHNLGNAYRNLNRVPEAKAAYREALRRDKSLAQAHASLAQLLQREGQFGDAVALLKQAVELEPANALFWESLAECYAESEDHSEAIRCWERVLALNPDRTSAHLGLGWDMQEEGRLNEAREHYLLAAKLQPNSASPQLRLGGLYEELGDLAEAESCFRKALQLQPDFTTPLARLATLKRSRLPDADRAVLEKRLTDAQLGDGHRARLLFGLAQVLDAQGDYSRATECLRQANAMTLESQRGEHRYQPADHERFVEGLLQAFGPDFFARMANAGLRTRRPVFVFGLPRSGTTLIEQVLASHPGVHGAGELRLARMSFEAIPATLGRSETPLMALAALDSESIQRLAEQHENQLRKLGGDAERVVDKMPENYLYLGLLAAMFPDAVFIHCRRDLRDLAVSCWMTDFRTLRWANDREHIAGRVRQYRRLMDHWRRVLPNVIHNVSYEETVADLESVARRLVAACGLKWDPACLTFHANQRPIRTASVVQVRQPVYTHSVERWRHYERDLAHLFAALPK
jgi:tetratricopeptide (TPR) repeat protein